MVMHGKANHDLMPVQRSEMKLMASYRVRNGREPGNPTIYHFPDPCLYGHCLTFVAEMTTAKKDETGYPVYHFEIQTVEPVALCLALTEIFAAFDELVAGHPDWIEYRWKLFCARGARVGTN